MNKKEYKKIAKELAHSMHQLGDAAMKETGEQVVAQNILLFIQCFIVSGAYLLKETVKANKNTPLIENLIEDTASLALQSYKSKFWEVSDD